MIIRRKGTYITLHPITIGGNTEDVWSYGEGDEVHVEAVVPAYEWVKLVDFGHVAHVSWNLPVVPKLTVINNELSETTQSTKPENPELA